ncbi:hypothetical protein LR48_Vigan10g213000 [Vigna angularis]|uniref:Uncharacterized protein n=1 Tax=Phaseolus angularis TaxID=3914 RepID=A0A0L9VMQ0_PHAAN|nr:hypothetical protein LR48_Vigan10g213000 [Vigna angularis]
MAEGVRLPNGGGDGGVCRGKFLVLVVYRFGVGEDDEGSRVEWRDCYGGNSLKWALLRSDGCDLRFRKREEDDARRWWSRELRP